MFLLYLTFLLLPSPFFHVPSHVALLPRLFFAILLFTSFRFRFFTFFSFFVCFVFFFIYYIFVAVPHSTFLRLFKLPALSCRLTPYNTFSLALRYSIGLGLLNLAQVWSAGLDALLIRGRRMEQIGSININIFNSSSIVLLFLVSWCPCLFGMAIWFASFWESCIPLSILNLALHFEVNTCYGCTSLKFDNPRIEKPPCFYFQFVFSRVPLTSAWGLCRGMGAQPSKKFWPGWWFSCLCSWRWWSTRRIMRRRIDIFRQLHRL